MMNGVDVARLHEGTSPEFVGCVSQALRVPIERNSEGDAHRNDDLLAWAKHYLPQHFTRGPSAMHRYLAAELDAMRTTRGTKLNVIGPRGSAKSTVATLAYVLRSAVEAREPYIWIFSDTRLQACAHLENIKSELTENKLLARDYPDAVGEGPIWRSGTIMLPNRVMIEAFGTGQKVRGKRRRATRPSLVLCDDIQSDAHASSRRRRAQCRSWFFGAVLQAGASTTNYVHLATALHREALAIELDHTPGWKSRKFPAIVQPAADAARWAEWRAIYCNLELPDAKRAARDFYEASRAAMDAGAEVLWPENESLYDLMCLAVEVGRSAFEREKQCSPIDPERCEFPEEYFGDDLWFDQWPAQLVLKTVALDPSKGRDDALGDYSAIVMLGIDATGMLYVAADLARRPTTAIVAHGIAQLKAFQPAAFGVEANQFQDLLAQQFSTELAAAGLSHISLWTLTNTQPKASRIRALEPLLSRRRLRFKTGCPSTRMLVEQLRDFPIADHDDGPDALEMALRLASALLQGCSPAETLGNRIELSV